MKTIINIKTNKGVKKNRACSDSAFKMTSELEKMLGPIEGDISKNKNLSTRIGNAKELRKHLSL